jgi:hypothetical protein
MSSSSATAFMNDVVMLRFPCMQVRALESQLAQLRGQAAEVEDKRVRLQQRQAAALEALSATTGRKMSVSCCYLLCLCSPLYVCFLACVFAGGRQGLVP